jgi:hypothetical protein
MLKSLNQNLLPYSHVPQVLLARDQDHLSVQRPSLLLSWALRRHMQCVRVNLHKQYVFQKYNNLHRLRILRRRMSPPLCRAK